MIGKIKELFDARSVIYAEAIPFSLCRVINERKAKALTFLPQSAILFAIPYYAGEFEGRNISLYAIAGDYHLFFKDFSGELIEALRALYPQASFAAFADSSPIDEREAAAMAGLGVIGQNGLLITEKYASFVFLGEILTDLSYEKIGTRKDFSLSYCEGCGKCLAACPKGEGACLSALTQKKGVLSKEESEALGRGALIWGCDLCQTACPHALKAEKTPYAFFGSDLIPTLTEEALLSMSKEAFSARAFSWRGKEPLLRNMKLMTQGQDESDTPPSDP